MKGDRGRDGKKKWGKGGRWEGGKAEKERKGKERGRRGLDAV